MVKKVVKVLGTIFLVIIPIFLTYYLNRTQPDVRYTLSQGIPVSFLGTSVGAYESIQQLEVRNIGNARAEGVVVKIEGPMTSYELVKYAASDVVQIFDQQQPIEIIYPGLPPQAGFKLIFQSPVSIQYDDLSITHNAGVAKEALSKPKMSVTLGILYGAYILILSSWVLFLVREITKLSLDSWKTREVYKSLDKLLGLSKPWYVAEDKWKTVHLDIVKAKVKDETLSYGRDIANSTAYKILSVEKPDHLDMADWNEVILLAVDRLEKGCTEMARGYTESQVMGFLRLQKPEHFPQHKWDDLSQQANRSFVELKKRAYFQLDGLLEALRQKKPTEVSETNWIEVVRYLQQQYYDKVMQELQIGAAPLEALTEFDLSLLDEQQRQNLKNWANEKAKYKELTRLFDALLDGQAIGVNKPELLDGWEWRELQQFEDVVRKSPELIRLVDALLGGQSLDESKPELLAEREWLHLQQLEKKCTDLASGVDRVQTFMQLLHTLLFDRQSLGDKPDSLTNSEWISLKTFDEQLKNLRDIETRERELQTESSRIAQIGTQMLFLKQRIERQLDIIHELLDDPSTIDRIESYDDTFAPGNLKNLKRVASILCEVPGAGNE